jgi:hypothetical protein
MGIAIGAAMCVLAGLGIAILFFMASGGKPDETDQMARSSGKPDAGPRKQRIEPKTEPPRNDTRTSPNSPQPPKSNREKRRSQAPDLPPSRKPRFVFLADLPERNVFALDFKKKGDHIVNREKSPNAIFLHPADNTLAYLVYSLNKQYSRFRTKVGINDTANGGRGSDSPLTFTVAGDKRILWQSKRIQRVGEVDICDISVEGLSQLIIQVHCQGKAYCAHAVWVEPQLEVQASPPIKTKPDGTADKGHKPRNNGRSGGPAENPGGPARPAP